MQVQVGIHRHTRRCLGKHLPLRYRMRLASALIRPGITELELHLVMAEDGDQQAKAHAGRQKKTKESDHRHIVPVRGDA